MSLALSGLFDWFVSRPPAIQSLVIAAGAVLAAAGVELLSAQVLKRLVRHTDTELDDVVRREAHTPMFVSVAVTGLYYATAPLALPLVLNSALASLTATIVVVVWARGCIRVGRGIREQLSGHETGDFLPFFQNIWNVVVLAGSGLIILSIWGIDITPLLASAGVVGVGVGFAAKDTVANLFGAVSLYFDDTYSVGDYITLSSGEEGFVEDISIRSTVLRTRDDHLITIPNSKLNSAAVTNESAPTTPCRTTVAVGVEYDVDIDVVEEALLDVADAHADVLDAPEPQVRFRAFGNSALQYELLCWVPSPNVKLRVTHELHRDVYQTFADRDITIPYPQRDVHLDTPVESE